jgi:hypothetical protein
LYVDGLALTLLSQHMERLKPFYKDPEPWPPVLRRQLRIGTIKQLKAEAIAAVFRKPV